MLPPKSLLTPGPWTAKGNTVKDGYGKPIATVFCRNATAHAYWIAHLPEFVAGFNESQAIAEFQKDVETLRDEIRDLKEQLLIAKDQIEDLRDERTSAKIELEQAEDAIVDLKSTIRTLTLVNAPEHV